MGSIYWVSTGLLSAFLAFSSYTYLFSQSSIEGVKELGLPDFFRVELAILKVIAAVLILLPFAPLPLKEWTYAGIGLFFITAIVAHIVHKDAFIITLINLVLVGLLIVSRIYLNKIV